MESYGLSPGPVVIVIGAGFGGILSAIHLKEKLGFHNFLVIEKADDIGGTWRDNTYPGCRCDIVSHFYSLSTDLKCDWDHTLSDQPSILAYMKDVIRKHDLEPFIVLNTEVVQAKWVESAQVYEVTTQNSKGVCSTTMANIVISATGVLHVPRMPNIPGMATFKGKLFHSAKWDASADLVGKRVAVIGNGSSAAQLLSEIPKIDGVDVTQFFRTPNWIFPLPLPRSLSDKIKWIFANVPFIARLWRWSVFWMLYELSYLLIFKFESTRGQLKKLASYHMLRRSPKKYHDILIPDFPVGARRILYDPGYLEALHRPNVEIRRTAVAEIYPEGVITADGEKLPFDVIICASGFIADKYPLRIHGRNNETVQEYYDKTEGPNAYLGMTVPGFPNLFLLAGPNTATGHTSILFFEEAQIAYISKFIAPVLKGIASSFEITNEANDQYNKTIQEQLKHTVYPFYSSWYRVNFTGRNCLIFPGSGIAYWWMCRSVNWAHYRITGLRGSVVDLNMRRCSDNVPLCVAAFGVVAFLVALVIGL